jgi:hypothetical protein
MGTRTREIIGTEAHKIHIFIHETSLCDVNVCAQNAANGKRITGPIFYAEAFLRDMLRMYCKFVRVTERR